MANPIISFTGQYAFLSNFHVAPILFDGWLCSTAEHAFQQAKTADSSWQASIARAATPGEAKHQGRVAPLHRDWEGVKEQVMLDVLRTKFASYADLADRLNATGDAVLTEGNTWGDRYWGVDSRTGDGLNRLGVLLMHVRSERRIQVAGPLPRVLWQSRALAQ